MNEEYKTESGQDAGAKSVKPLTETNQFAVNTGKKPSGKKKLGVLSAIAVVLVALVIGLGIYNKPENRLARQLDLGNRYLEEQNYAEAALAFEKAIQIDERCLTAYVNGIEAYRHLDEPENLLAFYEKALEAARSLEGEKLATDMDAVVSIYLAAEDVYTDREALVALWEEGYEKSGQDGRVRDGLVRVYLTRAEERASDGAYEESLQDYDRLLELDSHNETVLESLTGSLKSYLDFLLGEGNFDRVRELAEKYASALPDFDFAYYLDEADRLEQEREQEELRSQLELPFTAEDVTLFGYTLTEDHFDDMIAFLDLPFAANFNDEYEWGRYEDDESCEAWADEFGSKGIRVSVETESEDLGASWAQAIEVGYSDYGYSFDIYYDGLPWLKEHYADSYNLPLLSSMGAEAEEWYRLIPADKIKETGEYDQETVSGFAGEAEKNSWVVKEPIDVSLTEWDYDSGFFEMELVYGYQDNLFSIAVTGNDDIGIYRMSYYWSFQ